LKTALRESGCALVFELIRRAEHISGVLRLAPTIAQIGPKGLWMVAARALFRAVGCNRRTESGFLS
jgi:hypothetical protein